MSDEPADSDGPIRLSFAEAYDQLREITERIDSPDVPVDELLELLRRGKGLETALRARLDEVEQQITAIEAGENIPHFEIT